MSAEEKESFANTLNGSPVFLLSLSPRSQGSKMLIISPRYLLLSSVTQAAAGSDGQYNVYARTHAIGEERGAFLGLQFRPPFSPSFSVFPWLSFSPPLPLIGQRRGRKLGAEEMREGGEAKNFYLPGDKKSEYEGEWRGSKQ